MRLLQSVETFKNYRDQKNFAPLSGSLREVSCCERNSSEGRLIEDRSKYFSYDFRALQAIYADNTSYIVYYV